MKHPPTVDAFLEGTERWRDECAAVRRVLLDTGLRESIKWGKPCFGTERANVAILQPMNDFLAVMFFKGALLEDRHGVLQRQGPNTRAARRVRITSVEDVDAMEDALRALVASAVAVEESGLALPPAPKLELVPELQRRLDADPDLRAAFDALTPGRQREYNLHVAGAKQSTTRARRVDKHVPRILAGKGLRDR